MERPGHELAARGLVKTFGRRTVVRDIDLHFVSNRIVGLLGPNGAGKTTTFSMLVGLVPPTEGKISLDGQDITDMPMHLRARAGIAYLPQEPSAFRKMTDEENLVAVLEYTDLGASERAARVETGLGELNLRALAKSPAYTLSGGERRRVEVARALVLSPKFFLWTSPFRASTPLPWPTSRGICSACARKESAW